MKNDDLLTKREFLDLCKNTFKFSNHGLSPFCKDVRCFDGSRILKCVFLGFDDKVYEMRFFQKGNFYSKTMYLVDPISGCRYQKLRNCYYLDFGNRDVYITYHACEEYVLANMMSKENFKF